MKDDHHMQKTMQRLIHVKFISAMQVSVRYLAL